MVQLKKVAPGVSYEKDKGSSLCHFSLSWPEEPGFLHFVLEVSAPYHENLAWP